MYATDNRSSRRRIHSLYIMLFRTSSAHDLRSSEYVRNNSVHSLLSSRSSSFHRPPQRQHQQLYHRNASSTGGNRVRPHSARVGTSAAYWRPAFIASGRRTPNCRVDPDPPSLPEEAFSRQISSLSLFRRLASSEEEREALVQRLVSRVDFPSTSSSFARHGSASKHPPHRRRTLSSSSHPVDRTTHSLYPHRGAAPPPASYFFCAPGRAKTEKQTGGAQKQAAGKSSVHLEDAYVTSEKTFRGTGLRVQSENEQNRLPSSSSALYFRKERGYGDGVEGDHLDARRREKMGRAHAASLRWNASTNSGVNPSPPPLPEGVAEHTMPSGAEDDPKVQRKEGNNAFAIPPSRRKNAFPTTDPLSPPPFAHALPPSASQPLHPNLLPKAEGKKKVEQEATLRAVKAAIHDLPPSLQSLVQRYGQPLSLSQLHTIATVPPSTRCDVLRMLFEGVEAETIIRSLLDLHTPSATTEACHERRDMDLQGVHGQMKKAPDGQREKKNSHRGRRTNSTNASPKRGSPTRLPSRTPQEKKRSAGRQAPTPTEHPTGRKGVDSLFPSSPLPMSRGGTALVPTAHSCHAALSSSSQDAFSTGSGAPSVTAPRTHQKGHSSRTSITAAAIPIAMIPPTSMDETARRGGSEGHEWGARPGTPQKARQGEERGEAEAVRDGEGICHGRLYGGDIPIEREVPPSSSSSSSPSLSKEQRYPTLEMGSFPPPIHDNGKERDSTPPIMTRATPNGGGGASSPPQHGAAPQRDGFLYSSLAHRLRQRDHDENETKRKDEHASRRPPSPRVDLPTQEGSTSTTAAVGVVPSVLPSPSPSAPSFSPLPTSLSPPLPEATPPHFLTANEPHHGQPEASGAPPPRLGTTTERAGTPSRSVDAVPPLPSSRSASFWRELTVSSASSSEDGRSFISIRANHERRLLSTSRPPSCSVSPHDGVLRRPSASLPASATRPLSHSSTRPSRATSTNAGGGESPAVHHAPPSPSATTHESAWDMKYKAYLHRYRPHGPPSPSPSHSTSLAHPLASAESASTPQGKRTTSPSFAVPPRRADCPTASSDAVRVSHERDPIRTGVVGVTIHADPAMGHATTPVEDRLSRLSSIGATGGDSSVWRFAALAPQGSGGGEKGSPPVSTVLQAHSHDAVVPQDAGRVASLSLGNANAKSSPHLPVASMTSPPPPPLFLTPGAPTGAFSASLLESQKKKNNEVEAVGLKPSLQVFEVERTHLQPPFSFASPSSVVEDSEDGRTGMKSYEALSSSDLAFRDLSPSVQPPPNCIRVVKLLDSPSPSTEPVPTVVWSAGRRLETSGKEAEKERNGSVASVEKEWQAVKEPTGAAILYRGGGVDHSHSPHPTSFSAETTHLPPSHNSSVRSDSDCTLSSCSRKSESLAMFVRNNTAPPPALDDTPPPTTKGTLSSPMNGGKHGGRKEAGEAYGPHTTRRMTGKRTGRDLTHESTAPHKLHSSRSHVSPTHTTPSTHFQEEGVEENGEDDLKAPFSRIDTAPPFPLSEKEKLEGPTGITHGRTPPRKVVESTFSPFSRTGGVARGPRARWGW